MANGTMEKIDSATVGSGGAASIVFNSIPQTYDDLLVVSSSRSTRTGFPVDDLVIRFNGTTTTYRSKRLYNVGGISNDSPADIRGFVSDADSTADAFGSNYFYIPNYRSANNKEVMVDGAGETNATSAGVVLLTGEWVNNAAISSITLLANNGNLTQYSTATLYGITRVPTGAKATGGVITDTATHWIHTFTSSGVFTPTANLALDYLIVAGGGGGGDTIAGGGGAGGLRTSTGLAVTANTNYTITVGAGGAGATASNVRGSNGGGSSGFSVSCTGGGGGGSNVAQSGNSGGSGGGAGGDAVFGAGGSGTAGEGNAGGNNQSSAPFPSGGGGGASQAGANGSGNQSGKGGDGTASSISGTSVTYAGGGGGGSSQFGATQGAGGAGGGGRGGTEPLGLGQNATIFTGSGGGGGAAGADGGAGASGIVIVRYAK
jgi:hypothetical protein